MPSERLSALLVAIRRISTLLLHGERWEEQVAEMLACLGAATAADRAALYKNRRDERGRKGAFRLAAWTNPALARDAQEPQAQRLLYNRRGLQRWQEILSAGEMVHGLAREFPTAEQETLAAWGVQAVAAAPVFADKGWWGFLALEACADERVWLLEERAALQTVAITLGAAMRAQQTAQALRDREQRLHATAADITERRRAEELAREERAWADALREATAALTGAFSLDEVLDRILEQAGRVLAHDAATIMLIEGDRARVVRSRGYKERGLGETVSDLAIPIASVPSLHYMAETGRSLAVPYAQSFPGWGNWPARQWIRSHASAPIRSHGKVIGFLNLDNELPNHYSQLDAERLQVFADQAGLAIEHARLYDSLAQANEQLRLAAQVKEDVINNVSHELRTPLTLILGYLDLLREGSLGRLTDDQQQALRAIEQHGKRLRFMVDRLLLLQSFDASLIHPTPEDVGSWLRQTVEAWSRPEIAGACQIRLELPDGLPLIYAELSYLDRVLENLLDNAIKFSPAGGQIVVAARASDTEVIVSVADQGIGLAPEKQCWLFERFYQADSGLARRFGGLGIGLALCKLIVEAHGGRIWAESAGERQGSTFYFALPRADIAPEHATLLLKPSTFNPKPSTSNLQP